MNNGETNLPAILGGIPAVSISHELSNRWPNLTHDDEKAYYKLCWMEYFYS